jgi:ATP-dependent RNA helicase DDX56/DBP9
MYLQQVLEKVKQHQNEGETIKDYTFDMKRLEPFRYRFADALRAVTRIAVREARIKELRSEILKSQKLSRYFEENPETLQQLRHDANLSHPARLQAHLKHVPDYLLPGGKVVQDVGFVAMGKEKTDRNRVVKKKGRSVRMGKGKIDPLKTFNRKGRGKK